MGILCACTKLNRIHVVYSSLNATKSNTAVCSSNVSILYTACHTNHFTIPKFDDQLIARHVRTIVVQDFVVFS